MAENITFDLVGGGTKVLPCIPTKLTESDRLMAGGFGAVIEFAINIRSSHFLTSDTTEITVDSIFFTADDDSPPPQSNKLCTFRGRRLRIKSAAMDAARAYVHVTFEDPNS